MRPWLVIAAACLLAPTTAPRPSQADDAAPNPEDVLKNLVIAGTSASTQKPLPKIGVVPSTATNDEDVTIHNVVVRDLELSGEFRVMPPSAAPDGLYLSDSPVDVKAWKAKGAEAVVKISGTRLASGKVELKGVAYLTDVGDAAVYQKTFVVDADQTRVESHRIADALIGALTGTDGGFSSELAFVYGQGKLRQIYVMDADGHDPRPVSPPNVFATHATFGPKHELYWVGSKNKGRFTIHRGSPGTAVSVKPLGSVYGLEWSRKRDKVAVSIAEGATIKLYKGPDLANLSPAFTADMALQVAWSPNDRLAASAAGKWTQQIFVEGKAISPNGLIATAPTFCRHPNGVRAVYTGSGGNSEDLVATGEQGGGTIRLTAGNGKNNHPACSPDGRLVAFFSTRSSGEGPGLYVMRVDGTHAKRISSLVGYSLSWGRLPKGKHTRLPAYTSP